MQFIIILAIAIYILWRFKRKGQEIDKRIAMQERKKEEAERKARERRIKAYEEYEKEYEEVEEEDNW